MHEIKHVKKILAIKCYLRSGSGLISSLLDNQENILTTPDDILKDFYNFWEKNKNFDNKLISKNFIKNFNIIFNSKEIYQSQYFDKHNFGEKFFREKLTINYNFNNLGKNKNKSIFVNKKKFFDNLIKLIGKKKTNSRNFFKAAHIAYAKAQNRFNEKKNIISFPLHVPNDFIQNKFSEDFKDAKYIYMIRNPINAIISQLSVALKNNYLSPRIAYYFFVFALSKGKKPSNIDKINWMRIKLEDLHLKPNQSRKKIERFLKIKINKKNFIPTWNGLLWHNEKSSLSLSKFDKNINKRNYENYISFHEKQIIEFFFQKKILEFGYKPKYFFNLFDIIINLVKIIKPFNFETIIFKKILERNNFSLELNKISEKPFLYKFIIFLKYYLKLRFLLLKEV